MDEPLTLDSGEGTMEHPTRHGQIPQPPPRYESYISNGTFYKQQRDKMAIGQNDDNNSSGDSSMFTHVYYNDDFSADKDERGRGLNLHKGFQMYSPPNTPPEPAPPDHHLLTPSSILKQLKESNASQSSLDEINCKYWTCSYWLNLMFTNPW